MNGSSMVGVWSRCRPGEPGRPVLHVGYRLVEHGGDGGRVGGVGAVGLEDDPAVGQFHQLGVSGQHPDQARLA